MTQGKVHSDRPRRLRNHCVPTPNSPGTDEVLASATLCLNSSSTPAAESFTTPASPTMVVLTISDMKALISPVGALGSALVGAECELVLVVYRRGTNHDMGEVSWGADELLMLGKSTKQRFDQ